MLEKHVWDCKVGEWSNPQPSVWLLTSHLCVCVRVHCLDELKAENNFPSGIITVSKYKNK